MQLRKKKIRLYVNYKKMLNQHKLKREMKKEYFHLCICWLLWLLIMKNENMQRVEKQILSYIK